MSDPISTSVYGFELKAKFEEMEDKLRTIYGEGEKIDNLLTGSMWSEPKDWMMALVKKERFLRAHWSKKNGASLPADIEMITLVTLPMPNETNDEKNHFPNFISTLRFLG